MRGRGKSCSHRSQSRWWWWIGALVKDARRCSPKFNKKTHRRRSNWQCIIKYVKVVRIPGRSDHSFVNRKSTVCSGIIPMSMFSLRKCRATGKTEFILVRLKLRHSSLAAFSAASQMHPLHGASVLAHR